MMKREQWLEGFKARFDGKVASEFSKTIAEEAAADFWLQEHSKEQVESGDREHLDPLFRAYRELRIMHQIEYANYKLRDDYKILSDASRRQATVLSTVGLICVVLICAL